MIRSQMLIWIRYNSKHLRCGFERDTEFELFCFENEELFVSSKNVCLWLDLNEAELLNLWLYGSNVLVKRTLRLLLSRTSRFWLLGLLGFKQPFRVVRLVALFMSNSLAALFINICISSILLSEDLRRSR